MLIRAARLRGRAAERVDLRAAVLVGDAAGTVESNRLINTLFFNKKF